jgi:hypothetical protein
MRGRGEVRLSKSSVLNAFPAFAQFAGLFAGFEGQGESRQASRRPGRGEKKPTRDAEAGRPLTKT